MLPSKKTCLSDRHLGKWNQKLKKQRKKTISLEKKIFEWKTRNDKKILTLKIWKCPKRLKKTFFYPFWSKSILTVRDIDQIKWSKFVCHFCFLFSFQNFSKIKIPSDMSFEPSCYTKQTYFEWFSCDLCHFRFRWHCRKTFVSSDIVAKRLYKFVLKNTLFVAWFFFIKSIVFFMNFVDIAKIFFSSEKLAVFVRMFFSISQKCFFFLSKISTKSVVFAWMCQCFVLFF